MPKLGYNMFVEFEPLFYLLKYLNIYPSKCESVSHDFSVNIQLKSFKIQYVYKAGNYPIQGVRQELNVHCKYHLSERTKPVSRGRSIEERDD